MGSKRVQVEIAGMTFQVVGEDDADYVRSLADEANSRIKDVENNNYRLNDVQLYLLSLLNALDDMHKLERSDKEASALAGDTEAMKEKLLEIETLKKEIAEKDERIEGFNKRYNSLKSEIKEKEEDEKSLQKELDELKRKSETFEEEIKSKDVTIQELEDKNYESQMRLIDLNKEIYVLRGDHEEK